MTECINDSLSYDDLTTYRAMLTLGKTALGTSRSYCCINNLGVTECINSRLSYQNFITYGAMLTLGKTALATGGYYRRKSFLDVRKHLDFLGVIITTRAYKCFNTCTRASRSFGYTLFILMGMLTLIETNS